MDLLPGKVSARGKLMHGINDCMAKQKAAYHDRSNGETMFH
jgi:hypothetical protein